MKKRMYSILDKTAGAYLNPFHCINDGDAVRLFTTFVNDGEGKASNIYRYPEQFALFYVGVFDDGLGKFEGDGSKELVQGQSVATSRNLFSIDDLAEMFRRQEKVTLQGGKTDA